MAAAKKQETGAVAKAKVTEPQFSKEQIAASAKYHDQRDLVDALLDEKKKYTFTAVDDMREKFMKGKVK